MTDEAVTPEAALRRIADYLLYGDWHVLRPVFGEDQAHCLANAAGWLRDHAKDDEDCARIHLEMQAEARKTLEQVQSVNKETTERVVDMVKWGQRMENFVNIMKFAIHRHNCVYWDHTPDKPAQCSCGLLALQRKEDRFCAEALTTVRT